MTYLSLYVAISDQLLKLFTHSQQKAAKKRLTMNIYERVYMHCNMNPPHRIVGIKRRGVKNALSVLVRLVQSRVEKAFFTTHVKYHRLNFRNGNNMFLVQAFLPSCVSLLTAAFYLEKLYCRSK